MKALLSDLNGYRLKFGRYGNSGAPSGSCEQAPIQETKDKNTSNTGDVRFQSRSRFIIGGQEENDNHDRGESMRQFACDDIILSLKLSLRRSARRRDTGFIFSGGSQP